VFSDLNNEPEFLFDEEHEVSTVFEVFRSVMKTEVEHSIKIF
jgi:hypothetical protein